jgi:hypothetical protein
MRVELCHLTVTRVQHLVPSSCLEMAPLREWVTATFTAVGRSSGNFLFRFRETRSSPRRETYIFDVRHRQLQLFFTNQTVVLISERLVLSGEACDDDLQWRHTAGTSNAASAAALAQSMATLEDVSQRVKLVLLKSYRPRGRMH